MLYLIDFEQEILQPLVDGSSLDVPVEESVAATLAGRAFQTGEAVTADRDGAVRVWVPVYEHSVRTGVLAVTVDDAAPDVLDHCCNLGMLAGLLVASAARYTDLVHVRKRGRSMSLAASMQWDLLPPLTLRTEQVVVAGMLEPAYEVAGDGFDHSINGDRVDVAVFDGMGHGIGSTLLTTLAMGAYRHQRRERRDLAATHATIDDAIARQFGSDAFVTGVLVRLDTATGALELTNAGHPSPLLLRDRQVVGELATEATVPFGVGGGACGGRGGRRARGPTWCGPRCSPATPSCSTPTASWRRADRTGRSSASTGWSTCSSGRPRRSVRPRRCCAGWSGRCSSTRAVRCATTRRWCCSAGPAGRATTR